MKLDREMKELIRMMALTVKNRKTGTQITDLYECKILIRKLSSLMIDELLVLALYLQGIFEFDL